MASVSVAGNKKVEYSYDKAGRLTSKKQGDTVLANYIYDNLDRRITAQYFDTKWKYGYDQFNQLVSASNTIGEKYGYEYDNIGNRIKANINGKEQLFKNNSLNQIVSDGYAYDAWGNMVKTPEAEYTYDLKNRLVEVKKKDGTVISYTYDSLDQRIGTTEKSAKGVETSSKYIMSDMVEYARKTADKSQFHMLGLDLAGSLDRTGAVGAVLASSNTEGKDASFYLYDGNGNVIATYDSTGKITSKLAYEPFGKQTTNINLPFTFSTKSVDSSDMSYYGFRFYNPMLAKWEKRDPIVEEGGFNIYAFIRNAPVDKSEYLGLDTVNVTDYLAYTSWRPGYTVLCSSCCKNGKNGYCLKTDISVTAAPIVYTVNNGQDYVETNAETGMKRVCRKRYQLASGTIFDFATKHENIHIDNTKEADKELKNIASGVTGSFYEQKASCMQVRESLLKNINDKYDELYAIDSKHEGDKWNGLRNSDLPSDYTDSKYWKEVGTKCDAWQPL